MKWFKNLRIKSKLLASFAVAVVFSIVLAVLAVFTVSNINSSYSYLLNFPQKRVEYLMQINTYCSDMRRTTTAIMLNEGDVKTIDNYWDQFEQAYNNVIDNADKYLDSNSLDTVRDPAVLSENSEIMQNIKKQMEGYRAQASLGTESARSANDFAATNAMFLGGAPMIAQVVESVDGLLTKAVAFTAEMSALNTKEKDAAVLLFAVLLAAIVVLSVVIALYVAGLISKPMATLTSFMKKAGATGDIALRPEDVENIGKLSQVTDEIGQCIGSTAKFVKHMIEVSDELETVASGDLSSELALLSEDDTMGLSLQKMVDNLNTMFNEINVSTTQVSISSKQMAGGAQSLAQGSTEQASAIEELSSSIGEIADKTKQNAEIAKEAAALSDTIKGNAEKGNAQMAQMMQAVKEINDASSQIDKVIKVIDDIAFQTNILALNAAVEAARAGAAGKGFAVVAEEVRNLAAKSAEAAKDTGGLIENSIEKANFGLNIATETSASLKEIVEGINRSAEIVAKIARSSDEQAGAISQINTGIEQVAQVVQQNSATAEESAAASEEMSGQSDILEQLLLQFKLKDSGYRSALSTELKPRKQGFAASDKASFPLANYGDGEYGKY